MVQLAHQRHLEPGIERSKSTVLLDEGNHAHVIGAVLRTRANVRLSLSHLNT